MLCAANTINKVSTHTTSIIHILYNCILCRRVRIIATVAKVHTDDIRFLTNIFYISIRFREETTFSETPTVAHVFHVLCVEIITKESDTTTCPSSSIKFWRIETYNITDIFKPFLIQVVRTMTSSFLIQEEASLEFVYIIEHCQANANTAFVISTNTNRCTAI